MFDEEKLQQSAHEWLEAKNTDKAVLDEIRRENAELGRTEKGQAQRALTMMIACMVIAWAVFALFDFVNGKGFMGETVVLLAALFGLCWGQYREGHVREIGWYAVAAGVVAVVLSVLHFMGIA